MAAIERRKKPRRRPDRLAYIKIQPDNGGALANVSEDGVGFQVVAGVIQDNEVNLWMQLDALGPIEACGEIAWLDETRRLGGIRFTQISPGARDQLRLWIAQANSGKNVVLEMRSITSPFQEVQAAKAVASGVAVSQPPTPSEPAAAADSNGGNGTAVDYVAPATPAATVEAPPTRPAPPVVPPSSKPDPAPFRRVTPRVSPKAEPAPAQPRDFVASRTADWDQLRNSMTRTPRMGGMLLTGPPVDNERTQRRHMIAACVAFAVMVLGLTTWLMSSYRGELGDTLIAMGQRLTGSAPATPDQHAEANAPDASPPSENPSTEQPGTARASNLPNENPGASPASSANPNVPAVANSLPGGTAPPNGATGTTGDTGATELGVAMQFLRGANGKSQPIQAVEWLWIAVEKGNMPAEVILADLYVRGEGVAQSCEEGRILLLAASKKGNAEATKALADLPSKGCPSTPAPGGSSSNVNPEDPSGSSAPVRPPASPTVAAPASTSPTSTPAVATTPSAPQM